MRDRGSWERSREAVSAGTSFGREDAQGAGPQATAATKGRTERSPRRSRWVRCSLKGRWQQWVAGPVDGKAD